MLNSKTFVMLLLEKPWNHMSNLSMAIFGKPINADLTLSVTPGLQDMSSQLVCSTVMPSLPAWDTVHSSQERETGSLRNNSEEFLSLLTIWSLLFGIQSWTTTDLSKLLTRKLTIREEETFALQFQKERSVSVDMSMISSTMTSHHP